MIQRTFLEKKITIHCDRGAVRPYCPWKSPKYFTTSAVRDSRRYTDVVIVSLNVLRLWVAIHPTWSFFNKRAKVHTASEIRAKRTMTQDANFRCFHNVDNPWDAVVVTNSASKDLSLLHSMVLLMVVRHDPITHFILYITTSILNSCL